ncbi:MAG: methionine--tRNA ligase subunit beta [Phycisphaerales bacterium]|nr:methionine--tRNA ligase subunit beta [Phycisphaerales bacterium]
MEQPPPSSDVHRLTIPPPPQSELQTVRYDDFARIVLKVATILEAKLHPHADKLLILQIDLGGEKRQICAGIRGWYSPESLVGRQVVVVANLAPRSLRGEISHCMLLAATDEASGNVILLTPEKPVAAGSYVK